MPVERSRKEIEDIAETVMTAAMQVHRSLGPGLLESTYRTCLCTELDLLKLSFQREVWLPLVYRNIRIERAGRIDLLVEKCVVIELKNVEALNPVHISQLLTYLRLSQLWLGLLINFNVPALYKGVKRVLNGYRSERLPPHVRQADLDTLEIPS